MNQTRQPSSRLWLLAGFAAIVIYYIFLTINYGGMFNFAVEVEYDVFAELVTRLLFTGDMEGLPRYCQEYVGASCELGEGAFSQLIYYERPLYFLYLAILRTVIPESLTVQLALGLFFIAASAYLVAKTLKPENPLPLFLLSALLISPYYVYQTYNQQPHIPELFLTAVGFYYFAKSKFAPAFFFLVLSVAFHPGNLVLFGSFGLYFIYEHRFRWREYMPAVLGGMVALGVIEGYHMIIFVADTANLFVHDFFFERLFFKSARISGGFSHSTGAATFFKNSLIMLPISTLGLLWVKSRRQFFVCTLPILVYLVATGFTMPGVHRVLAPVYFMAYMYFLSNFLGEGSRILKVGAGAVIAGAALLSISYHTIANGPEIARDIPVSISSGISTSDANQLHRNLKRVTTIHSDSNIVYSVESSPVTERPNVATPFRIYPYLLVSAASKILPADLFEKLDASKKWSQKGALRVVRMEKQN